MALEQLLCRQTCLAGSTALQGAVVAAQGWRLLALQSAPLRCLDQGLLVPGAEHALEPCSATTNHAGRRAS